MSKKVFIFFYKITVNCHSLIVMSNPRSTSPYKKSQSLVRGLAILQALSICPDGSARINELSQATGIHRTTIKRLLQTLIEEGYVSQSPSDHSYRLSYQVRQLSEGFRDDDWVTQIAAPAINELVKLTLWPSDLCTLSGASVIIRETSHRFSSLSFHRAMIRRRLPLLTTAAGRAYFCFCPEQERQQLIPIIQTDPSPQAQLAHNPAFLRQLVEKTQLRGYASNEGDWVNESNTAAIALPITYKRRVISTVNLVFLKKILRPEAAAARYLHYLKETVTKIENQLAQYEQLISE